MERFNMFRTRLSTMIIKRVVNLFLAGPERASAARGRHARAS